ncbi:GNAT family N-acetyltransferase [Streptomyces sp. NPDC048350]|uniref:GNAT family N-acetyltransferase n=1 Tax=Streptomyces sp. NPDC048350 TaxID=3365538 RepID=UPI0037218459
MPPRRTEAQVRPGTEGDLAPLPELYDPYDRETAITFDTEPFTPERRLPWLRSYPEDGPHRLLVAHDDRKGANRRILEYATSCPFLPKPAYSPSVEVSVHLSPDAAGRGIGTLLHERLFEALAAEDLHRAYPGIALPNEPSIASTDMAWYEKRLGPGN